MCDSVEAIRAAKREATRCRRAVENGSPRQFWIDRLTEAAKRYEAAAATLHMQADEIRSEP